MIPLIIDGPAKGRVMDMNEQRYFQFAVQHPIDLATVNMNDPIGPSIDILTYHVYPFNLGEYTLYVASLELKPPSMERLLKIILTRRARLSMVRRP